MAFDIDMIKRMYVQAEESVNTAYKVTRFPFVLTGKNLCIYSWKDKTNKVS